MRTTRIVAVFGGGSRHETFHPCAKLLGRRIAQRGHILLTRGHEARDRLRQAVRD